MVWWWNNLSTETSLFIFIIILIIILITALSYIRPVGIFHRYCNIEWFNLNYYCSSFYNYLTILCVSTRNNIGWWHVGEWCIGIDLEYIVSWLNVDGFGLVIGFIGLIYNSWIQFINHYHIQTSVHSHDFISRCSVAASNCGRSLPSGFRTIPVPQLPLSKNNGSQQMNSSHYLTRQQTTSFHFTQQNSTTLTKFSQFVFTSRFLVMDLNNILC
jgi:hypothetical protein